MTVILYVVLYIFSNVCNISYMRLHLFGKSEYWFGYFMVLGESRSRDCFVCSTLTLFALFMKDAE